MFVLNGIKKWDYLISKMTINQMNILSTEIRLAEALRDVCESACSGANRTGE
jgi:hypothetical protein